MEFLFDKKKERKFRFVMEQFFKYKKKLTIGKDGQ